MQKDFDIRKASQRFIEIRVSEKKTQEQLAEDLGINTQTVKNYEKAGSPNAQNSHSDSRVNAIAGMKIETLYKMAKLFKVSTDYLLGLSDIPTVDKDVQAVCNMTGLKDDYIYNLMGLCEPEDAIYLRDMANEFLSYAVDGRAIDTYKDFRKYIDMDNQRWHDLNNLSTEDYKQKDEHRRKFAVAAEKNGYLIMSFGDAAEKKWEKLQEDYGEFLLSQYRRFDNNDGNPI